MINKKLDDLMEYVMPMTHKIRRSYDKLLEMQKKSEKIDGYAENVKKHVLNQIKIINACAKNMQKTNKEECQEITTLIHDLKGPSTTISNIVSLIGLMQKNDEGEEINTYINMIDGQITYQEKLFYETKKQIESKEKQYELKEEKLQDILKSVEITGKILANQKKLDFETNYDQVSKINIITNKTMLERTLNNITINAIKYTDQGKIELGIIEQDNAYEFYVKDTGIGIPTQDLSKIFEPNFKASNNSNQNLITSEGLGLSIVKKYIENLGGEIRVESKEGKGSTFYFTTPKK